MPEINDFKTFWKKEFQFWGCREPCFSLSARDEKVKLSQMLSFIAVTVSKWVPYETLIANRCQKLTVLTKIGKRDLTLAAGS